MKLDIRYMDRNFGMNCFESGISSYANWKKYDYEMMFLNSWKLIYEKDSDSMLLSEKINIWDFNARANLKKYHGIELKRYEQDDFDGIVDKIQAEIENQRPVIAYINMKYCHWVLHEGHGFDSEHYGIISGFDKEKSIFYVQDSLQKGADSVVMDLALYRKAYKDIYLFIDAHDQYNPNCDEYNCNYNYKELLPELLDTIINNILNHHENRRSMFENIEMLAVDLKENLDYDAEIKGYGHDSYHEAGLFSKFAQIAMSREKFSKVLLFLGEKTDNQGLIELHKKIYKAGRQWGVVKIILQKLFFTRQKEQEILDDIYKRIMNINDMEKDLLNDLIKIRDGRYISKAAKNPVNTKDPAKLLKNDVFRNKATFIVALEQYYDHCTFSKVRDKTDIEIGSGIYYKYESEKEIEDNQYINLLGKNKILKNLYNEKNDNMICDGQIINIDDGVINIKKGVFDKIILFGFSAIGPLESSISVIYDDNAEIEHPIHFSLYCGKPVYNNELVWSGECLDNSIVKDGNRGICYEAGIFSCEVRLAYNESLKAVRLSDHNAIHIFAMLLEGEEAKADS